ncbi:MAG: M48 family metallopeptidase [Campylobacterales bacterium]|nr:M48 family metallopeptidase [Campylobacterales bacterium]
MIVTLMALFTLYAVLKLYISVMQIGYIKERMKGEAVLMSPRRFHDAALYAVEREKLSMVSTLIEYVLFVLWIGALLVWLADATMTLSPIMQSIVVVMGFVLIGGIVSLPLEWYGKFVIDAHFGFNRSSYAQYIKDTLIATLLTLIFGSLVIAGVHLIIANATLWWLWSFGFIFAVVIAINMLFPTVRALFFDKLTPLQDAELDAQIAQMMRETGFQSSGVFVSDASKRDAKLNAYFGGLGRSKRVVLFDTLLQKLNHKELLAVLGHELGHFAHGDIYKNIASVGAMLFVMFAFFGNLPESLYLELGIAETPGIVMVLFLLLMSPLGFVMMPLMGLLSRHNEFEADREGARLGGSEYLVGALKKLVEENKSFPYTHPLYLFFYTTHPLVLERLKALGADLGAQSESHEVDDLGGLWPSGR